MSSPFVPFNRNPAPARSGSGGAFRLAVVPRRQQATAPAPVGAPAPTSPAEPRGPTRIPAVPEAQAHTHSAADGAEPEISLERDGDRITRITVRCSCGRVVELDCAYPDRPDH